MTAPYRDKPKFTLYPTNMKYVRPDKNLLLYNVFYHASIDTLFITYKNVDTGEQIQDAIEEPLIPVFISKQPLDRMEQVYPYEKCIRHMIRYNNKYKSEDLKELLYPSREIRYKDSNGQEHIRMIFDNIPKGGFALNPSLFGYGNSIEQIILQEYALQRFGEHDGFASEVVPATKFNIASFDIETIQEDETVKININTFVDRKSNTAYALFVKDYEKYPYQDTIMPDLDNFINETRSALLDQINNSKLDQRDPNVQALLNRCRDFSNALTFKIIECQDEQTLISLSSKIMFEVHSPDVLMAFNTPYDLTHFQKRAEELNMPVGILNDAKYRNVRPKFMDGMNTDTWTMFGDTRTSKKRSCSFHLNRKTHVVDYQMIYYSNKSFLSFNSESLQETALRELGFGKLDYSKWANSVVQLPYKNFRVHLSYGLIDSIILIMLNEKTNDIESKLAYTIATKNNIEMTVHSNPSISNWVATTCMYYGFVPGVNLNKLIKKLTNEELGKMSEATNVDFSKYKANIPSSYLGGQANDDPADNVLDIDDNDEREVIDTDISIRGGIVSPPQNYAYNFNDFKRFNILNNEVSIRVFLKAMNVVYLDFKSHYPFSFITRNLFKQCINAEIVEMKSDNGELKFSKNINKRNPKYVENFGFIHMPIVNKDIVTYASRTCGTPTITEIIEKVIPLDSKPIFEPSKVFTYREEMKGKAYDPLISLLTTLDKSKFSDTEDNFFAKTNTLFLGRNGVIRYYGSRLEYNYNGKDLVEAMTSAGVLSNYPLDTQEPPLFGKEKTFLSTRQNMYPTDVKPVPELEYTDWRDFPVHQLQTISELDFTSEYVRILGTNITLLLTNQVLYFPYKHYFKQRSNLFKDSEKTPVISNLKYRYSSREDTTVIQFLYNIKFKEVDLDITQTTVVVNI